MSTHRLILKRQKSGSLTALALFFRLSIAFLLWLSLASTVLAAADESPLRQSQLSLPPQGITRAGVSVVRLLVTYTGSDSAQSGNTAPVVAQCTGLGVLVASSLNPDPQASPEYSNWVLTDGNLVNASGDKATCASNQPSGRLASVNILPSTAYNSSYLPLLPPATTDAGTTNFHCLNTDCSKGPILFPFSTDTQHPQPFLNIAKSTVATQALILAPNTNKTGPLSVFSSTNPKDPQQFRNLLEGYRAPEVVPMSAKTLEAGTPSIDDEGNLAGIHLSSANENATADVFGSFVSTTFAQLKLLSSNAVHDNWNTGVDDLYHSHLDLAQTNLKNASAANTEFTAGKALAATATIQAAPPASTSATSSGNVLNDGITIAGYRISLLLLSLAGLTVLILFLLIAYWIMSQARARRKFREELAAAEQDSERELQRIEEEATQQSKAQMIQVPAQSLVPAAPTMLRCPRCNEFVARDATICPRCQLFLSPSESGLHLRINPAAPQAAGSASGRSLREPQAPPMLADQPTMVPVNTIGEQPTIELAPGTVADPDRTVPLNRRVKPVGFVVGTHSDPGIKRKFKPNEDSLFAAQGPLGGHAGNQPFGLFVVADGMGGHAQGEDASQLAIQKIVDTVLIRLAKDGSLQNDDGGRLLMEGIQTANQAVHQHNMDERGDMGTTVTAALVLGSQAYVANVGDSRTYLYRKGEGLRKITNDHSVVASLVEAGIIKPDDIYTHPKRNQIYRSLGEKPAVDIDCFPLQLQEGDKLLLCSDGLWDMVRDPQIEEVVKNTVVDPNQTGDALIQAALAGGGEDNVSVIVVQITDATRVSAGRGSVQILAKPESVQLPSF
ncbi:PP2C family serine/threonine-protein phosphatase [Tengunoibacter tsumagoiensis]|uniref:PPM-type phosphatase domain-containing protein n=1 Tax=Tengunoibacter tsumagoiensis TaxID=2014871 RepID=A0A402A4S7_9CHLR|nr:protein phosphatase 2C domain-containing protein [Tengunoibacter tsumagoiensis]GCE14066.1 hypothetical protein KTT_39250 [Tengunoibacter tsumagoiensis]